jgi:3-hydroxyisobutyrate dehydrogenase-like beta-hydroxyacid dehydrogenase
MARRVVHCGDQGTGLAAKIANNFVHLANSPHFEITRINVKI